MFPSGYARVDLRSLSCFVIYFGSSLAESMGDGVTAKPMAEREGFEPSIGVTYTPLAGERLRPLGHLSDDGIIPDRTRQSIGFNH